jgi:1-acyl-sn-glycerol-3-phosphate acyltransferase
MMGHEALTPFHVRCLRYARLVWQLIAGLLTVALLFPFYGRSRRWRAVQKWSRGVVRCAGVEVRVSGAVPPKGGRVLGVANHVSWLDIQVLHSVWNVRFVAKSEVRRWPLIGWLSARTGTLFVDRANRRHAARINQSIHQAFADGDPVAVFPEGTTTRGDQLLRFHASLLQPAVDEQALIVPVAIRYSDAQGRLQPAAAYVGDMSLMESLGAIIRVPRIYAEVQFLAPIESRGRTRRELAQASHASVAAALRLPAADS